jgi:hypothetical protein
MPRRPKHLKKTAKLQLEQLERKCPYCKAHVNSRRFDKHKAWCKTKWTIEQELKRRHLHTHTVTSQTSPQLETAPGITASVSSFLRDSQVNEEFVEGSSEIPMEVEYPSPDLDDLDLRQEYGHGTYTIFWKVHH